MVKKYHEIRDPICNFIRLDINERNILDSQPFQRLRNITQLATTYLIYPSATHKRFEHSLGTLELATRVFDVITNPDNVYHDQIRDALKTEDLHIWRKTLRAAALCHDIGHFPFSHAAEELLPEGKTHETFTLKLILDSEISNILKDKLKLQPKDVAKLALKPKDYQKEDKTIEYSNFEAIMSEIITGDAFGVDRMDYLLRDSYHAGVAYGKFDQYRLIDTLRILPKSENESEPTLGIEEGGIHSAEAFCLARYYMFSQLYLHSVRRVYDLHLVDFLKKWLQGGKFQNDLEAHIRLTDNEVSAALLKAAKDNSESAHEEAKRLVYRKHFKKVYEVSKQDLEKNIDALQVLYENLINQYGVENIKKDNYGKKGGKLEFPVLDDDSNKIKNSTDVSDILCNTPDLTTNFIFANPEIKDEVKKYIEENKNSILENKITELKEDNN
jgi:hypothetical protein